MGEGKIKTSPEGAKEPPDTPSYGTVSVKLIFFVSLPEVAVATSEEVPVGGPLVGVGVVVPPQAGCNNSNPSTTHPPTMAAIFRRRLDFQPNPITAIPGKVSHSA